MGLEPTNAGTTIRCVNPFATVAIILISYISQSFFLKKMGRPMGLEPTNAGTTIRCVNPFATIAILNFKNLIGRGSRN
jgi:hypothetical protein